MKHGEFFREFLHRNVLNTLYRILYTKCVVIKKDFKAEKIAYRERKNEMLETAKKELKKSFSWDFFGKMFVVTLGTGVFLFFVIQAGGFLQTRLEDLIRNRFSTELKKQEKTNTATQGTPKTYQYIQESTPGTAPAVTPQEPDFNVVTPVSPMQKKEELVSTSFSDLFSGVGRINQDDTTMYHDRIATAYTFAPKFKWERRFSSSFDETQLVALDAAGRDVRCIRGKCLLQKNISLSFNGQEIMLPVEVRDKKIETVSIGMLSSRWVVGVVVAAGGEYEGWVFSFDGERYEKVFGEANTPFVSKYTGILGFGGTDDDWIALYGGYEGIAYRIRSGAPFENISNFFGYRMMGEGFHPVILRAGNGVAAQWYISSLTEGKPRLLKLSQNPATGKIEGILDFAPGIFISTFKKASFNIISASEDVVILGGLMTTQGGTEEIWEFTDGGFIYPEAAEVVSVNLNNYPAEVRNATVVESELYADGNTVEYYLSNNGKDWVRAELGKEMVFPDTSGTRLLWRARFIPNSSTVNPPFFDRIRVDYKVKFL